MGPVSFESIAVGPIRAEAIELAGGLRQHGIRVEMLDPVTGVADAPYRLLVRSADIKRVHLLLEEAGHGPGSAR